MITQHLAPESARELRLKLYNDPVFLIAHEAVRPKLRHIDLVALFVSAQNSPPTSCNMALRTTT